MATDLAALEEATTGEGPRRDSNGLTRIAMSATERDLPSLSLVLDTALSILFARAAMINLLQHVATPSAKYSCPFSRLEPKTTKGSDVDHEEGTLVATPVVRGIMEALAVPDNQQCIVDLTKTLVTR